MKIRYDELDSMRGLAAISVVLLHFSLLLSFCMPNFQKLLNKFEHTPVQIFWSGNEAVILFFVLSGFVLSLPYYNNQAPTYKAYLIKRICRIYIPYIVSVLLAIVFMHAFYREGLPAAMGGWFNFSINDFPIKIVISHLMLLGEFDSYKLNIVFWSLAHEMRISLIFPIVMFVVLKNNWKRNLFISILFSISFFLIYYLCVKLIKYDITKNSTSYFYTLRYLFFFIVGALLAKHKDFFQSCYKKVSFGLKLIVVLIGVLTYMYPLLFFIKSEILHLSFLNDLMIAIGCSIFIVLSINSRTLKSILLLKPIYFIGKVSYSLYLCHMIILLAMYYGLYGRTSTVAIFIGAFAMSFIVASIMYYLIEKPSMTLGKYLTKPKKVVIPGATKIKTPA